MRRLCILILLACIAACSSPKKTVPPAELVKIDAHFKLQRIWNARVGATKEYHGFRVQPAVDGERLYVSGGAGQITALALESGKKIWTTTLDDPVSAGLVVGSTMLFAGTDGGQLVAIQKSDGAVQWQTSLSTEVLGNLALDDGVIVARCGDGKVFGIGNERGRRLWIQERPLPALSLRGTSSPVVAGNRVIVGFADGKLDAFRLGDGKLLWDFTLAVPQGHSELERLVDIDSTPVVDEDTVYAVSYRGRLVAVRLETGQLRWSRDLSSYRDLARDDELLFVVDENDHLLAFDLDSGTMVWKQDQLHERRLTAASVVAHELVLVGDYQGYLHMISRKDGSLQGRYHFDSAGLSAAPLVADGVVYVHGNNGRVAALRVVPVSR